MIAHTLTCDADPGGAVCVRSGDVAECHPRVATKMPRSLRLRNSNRLLFVDYIKHCLRYFSYLMKDCGERKTFMFSCVQKRISSFAVPSMLGWGTKPRLKSGHLFRFSLLAYQSTVFLMPSSQDISICQPSFFSFVESIR